MTIKDSLESFTGLAKFTSDGCAPCKVQQPILEKVCADHSVSYIEFNIDDEDIRPEALSMGIKSVPTLIFLMDGVPQAIKVGVKDDEEAKILGMLSIS